MRTHEQTKLHVNLNREDKQVRDGADEQGVTFGLRVRELEQRIAPAVDGFIWFSPAR